MRRSLGSRCSWRVARIRSARWSWSCCPVGLLAGDHVPRICVNVGFCSCNEKWGRDEARLAFDGCGRCPRAGRVRIGAVRKRRRRSRRQRWIKRRRGWDRRPEVVSRRRRLPGIQVLRRFLRQPRQRHPQLRDVRQHMLRRPSVLCETGRARTDGRARSWARPATSSSTCCGTQCCTGTQICCTVTLGPTVTGCFEPVNGTCPTGCCGMRLRGADDPDRDARRRSTDRRP